MVVRALVLNTPRISTEEVATAFNVDRSTALRRLKNMGFDLKLDMWVPHLLTERSKIKRISAAVSLLGRLENDPFLDRLVTGDEEGVLYTNEQAGEHGDTMAKASLHLMKVMLCVWWDCKGIIYFELLPAGQTIDSDKILSNRKGIVFHQDNARPHVSRQTLRKLNSLKWDVMS